MSRSGISARSGINGRVSLDGTVANLAEWKVTTRSEFLDTSNHESNGYEEGIFGFRGADITLTGDWDAALNPFDDPPNLEDGQFIANTKLYISRTDDKYYNFAEIAIISADVTTPAKGKVSFSVTAKANGTFTVPSGSV